MRVIVLWPNDVLVALEVPTCQQRRSCAQKDTPGLEYRVAADGIQQQQSG